MKEWVELPIVIPYGRVYIGLSDCLSSGSIEATSGRMVSQPNPIERQGRDSIRNVDLGDVRENT